MDRCYTIRDFQGKEETEESQRAKGMGCDSAAKRMDGCGFDEALGPRNLVVGRLSLSWIHSVLTAQRRLRPPVTQQH